MQKFFATCIVLFASVANAQPPQVTVPPQAPPVEADPSPPVVKKELSEYEIKYLQAMRTKTPFVVYVNCDERKVSGTIGIRVDENNGDARPRIIVAPRLPAGGPMLSPNATIDQIRAASTEGTEAKAMPSPFGLRPGEEQRTADDDAPWPAGLPFPTGAQRYAPSKFTQRTFNKGIIEPVRRAELKMKWQVPGGMEGVRGWRSDLYRYVPDGYQDSWKAWIAVFNGSNDQDEVAWTRSRPEGTFYMDVLSHKGKVFEVRVRERDKDYAGNLKWSSFISFRDPESRPPGYVALTSKDCAGCHNEAGTGGYGVGLVPGGGTVLSDPFPSLEPLVLLPRK